MIKTMKVLLIRPKPDKETIGLQNVMICEPLELEYICSLLDGDGHQVDIADMILERRSLTHIIKEYHPDLVGITAYITHVNIVKSYARIIKDILPGCKVVVGGVHAEVVPQDFEDPSIDYILQANSLGAFKSITHALAQGNLDACSLKDVWTAQNPNCVKKTEFNYPWPDREKVSKYRHLYYYMFHNPCALVKTSFGCPYKCSFCFCREITDGKYFVRPLEDVLGEIKSIQEDEVYIVDDNFLVDRSRVLSFCEGLQRLGIQKRFLIYGRADFIAENEDVIKVFAACGLRAVIVGVESFSPEELIQYNKQSTAIMNEQAVAILKDAGVECYATLILGLDWDDKRFRDLGDWLKKLGLMFINLQPFTPLPGTPLYEQYESDLIVTREEYEKWDLAHLTVKPSQMTLRRYYFNIIKLYYKITMDPGNVWYLVKKYGWRQNLKLSVGALKITMQYVRKILKG